MSEYLWERELLWSFPWGTPFEVVKFTAPVVMGKQRVRYKRGRGKPYTPDATTNAQEIIERAYREAAEAQGVPMAPAGWPVAVTIAVAKRLPASTIEKNKRLYAERDLTRPDLDNVAKLVLDALEGAAYKDDCQVVELTITRAMRTRDIPASAIEVAVKTPKTWDPKKDNVIRRDHA